jgi:hypothetical protein
MSLIRVSRGVPKFNIQIGPQKDALNYNPSAILSVTDDFEWKLMQHPMFKWLPINEIAKSWGYMPFFATKKVLDFWCLDMGYPLVYLCCTAGKHRSPMVAFCWLLSFPGATPESVNQEFFGSFTEDGLDLLGRYKKDIEKGYIPDDLPELYKAMREDPGGSFRKIMQGMLKYERITYTDSKWAVL